MASVLTVRRAVANAGRWASRTFLRPRDAMLYHRSAEGIVTRRAFRERRS